MERWKDIKGYKGRYQVSDLGRVKSLGNDKSRKEKIMIIQKGQKRLSSNWLDKKTENIRHG